LADERTQAEAQLRDEVSALGVAEILALCYAFQHKVERLFLYLDVLRRRGGERAQFAACLICFDLARQGDEGFQKEFAFLADTMIELGRKADLVHALVGDDPYLSFLWELCQAHLAEMDPRFEAEQMSAEATEFATVDLLSDDDFDETPDFAIAVEDASLWQRFDQAVEDFLGGEVGVPVYDPDAGFRVSNSRDVGRVEQFLRELDSLRDLIPMSRGFRALVLLFYGTHMRSRKLFGAVNQRKQQLLREGLREFVDSGPQVWEIAGVLGPLHSTPAVWDKISDVLIDFAAWMARNSGGEPEEYAAVERLLERQPRLGNRRFGARA
jgi:hypothetical protein